MLRVLLFVLAVAVAFVVVLWFCLLLFVLALVLKCVAARKRTKCCKRMNRFLTLFVVVVVVGFHAFFILVVHSHAVGVFCVRELVGCRIRFCCLFVFFFCRLLLPVTGELFQFVVLLRLLPRVVPRVLAFAFFVVFLWLSNRLSQM